MMMMFMRSTSREDGKSGMYINARRRGRLRHGECQLSGEGRFPPKNMARWSCRCLSWSPMA
jgi:hypothetical protein